MKKNNQENNRPDPDALLKEVNKHENKKGSLKIFLGYAPGVGKTYTMLEEAKSLKKRGINVVVGIVETHKRKETEALLEDLEILPRKEYEYKGVTIKELDLDLVLQLKPELILIDELAHSNIGSGKHPKRYQDIEELLENNIDVYTTVNIQHFESVNDIIAQITGIRVQETLPDSFLDRADEIEIIDIPIETLHERLKDGKVYIPEQASRAIDNFFARANLTALRELSLRRVANKLDDELVNHMKAKAINVTWATSERLLVSVAPSPYAEALIRKTYQIANDSNSEWFALYIEVTPRNTLSIKDRTYLTDALQLAEKLGAKVHMTSGIDTATELSRFANQERVTKVIMGKPKGNLISQIIRRSPAYKILVQENNFDIHFITPISLEKEFKENLLIKQENQRSDTSFRWKEYLLSLFTLIPVTSIGFILYHIFQLRSFETFFILSPITTALLWGVAPSLFISIINIIVYDFLFVAPLYTFSISRVEYIFDLIIFFITSIIIGQLTNLIRKQKEALKVRLEHVRLLEEMGRELLKVSITEHIYNKKPTRETQILKYNAVKNQVMESIAEIGIRYINKALNLECLIMFESNSELVISARSEHFLELNNNEKAIALWVYDNNQLAGKGTKTLASSNFFFFPINLKDNVLGIVGINSDYGLLLPNEKYLLSSIIRLLADTSVKYVSIKD